MQTKQCVRLHSESVVQMFYAIASVIKGTLKSWGQTESSYFQHLCQAGVEPRHLAAESPLESLSHPAAGWPLALGLPVPLGTQVSLSLQETGFVHDVRGEATEGKAIRGYQTQSSNYITRRGRNRGSMAVWLALISKSSSDISSWPLPFCWRQDSKLDRPAASPWVNCLVSHTMTQTGEWRGSLNVT